MKNLYTTIVLLLCISIAQAQTFEFSLSYVGINGSTNNHQFAFIATPNSTVVNGVTADMGCGFYIPNGLTIGNFVLGNSGLPINEWSVQSLGSSNANGDPYFVSRLEAGGSSLALNGDGPFELVLFDVIANPNPTSGDITFVENSDPVFNEILFVQNYININLGSGTIDAYSQNNPTANSVEFSTLSNYDLNAFSDEIRIYPNPVTSNLIISSKFKGSYVINTMSGKLIFKGEFFSTQNTIDLTMLNSGVYFIQIVTENRKLTKKIVKN
ncbi:hypothetical protein A9Q87_13540 [Flavobacteriales bacterium 34_180_T64]|nr:hypothetical protein A9Q87_13540 [Flavobacteriales bacterium 34_180_T64]